MGLTTGAAGLAEEDERAKIPAEVLEHRPYVEGLELTKLEEVHVDAEDLSLSVPASSTFGEDAGCDATGGSFEWAQRGSPSAPCDFQTLTFGITHTAIRCTTQDCHADAFDWTVFTFILVSCDEGGSALVDWTTDTLLILTGSCDAFSGGNPASFASWDSQGLEKWTHADNEQDAIAHLLL